ncbi:HD-GYP domain-containing protein [Psychrilyobacter atlanticus]|uniref:HD-GYP domain-containing protein n=1 Tax=Psychrilyobacter atlanticus TaxID=271091 RepID=UPI000421AC58|nr:HD domain-containing phosphohydrolase [Psychrilyobacter atlanticus]
MEYINSTLITLGMVFIFLGLVDSVKILKDFENFYKAAKYSYKTGLITFSAMLLFLFLYVTHFSYIILKEVINNEFTHVSSMLFFMDGFFIYTIIFLLKNLSSSLNSFYMQTISSLIRAVKLRDKYTSNHSEHVANLVKAIFEDLPGELKKNLSKNELVEAALLHDIGKIITPLTILNKKSELSVEEYEQIKKHVSDGIYILEPFEVFHKIIPWIKYHHERIDGQGYYKLEKNKIPLESKIIAVADTYSALTTSRIYQRKRSHREAVEVLKAVSGTQLDSGIVEILIKIENEKMEKIFVKSGFNVNSKILVE